MKMALTLIIAVALVVLGVMYFGSRTDNGETPDPNPGNGEASEETVQIYFYNESADTDETGNIACSPDSVQPIERTVDVDTLEDEPIQTVLGELFEGPTAAEQAEGFSSEFPLEGFEVADAAIADGEATVTLNDPENATTGGSCRVTLLYNQVAKTVGALDGVDEVVILPETLFQP